MLSGKTSLCFEVNGKPLNIGKFVSPSSSDVGQVIFNQLGDIVSVTSVLEVPPSASSIFKECFGNGLARLNQEEDLLAEVSGPILDHLPW